MKRKPEGKQRRSKEVSKAGRSKERGFRKEEEEIPVLMRLWETPVPIPNTKVKTQAADGTILETIWESRWVPD